MEANQNPPSVRPPLNQQSTPLFDAVVAYAKDRKISFHTPGHKHGSAMPEAFRKFAGEHIFDMDLTLLDEVDSLHDPKTVIKEAQALAAQAYEADASFFLVNGTSGGNQAMIMATCYPGDKIIVPRNCHKSVLSGIILAGCQPIFIQPEINSELAIFCNVSNEQIKKALKEHPTARAVLVTHPTYQGIAADLAELAKIVHAEKKLLLVDEAHGPHLRFHEDFPLSAMEAGADLCVESMHKIVSGMTQASILHVRKKNVDLARLKRVLQLLTTTSPSYILMCSLDVARMQMATEGQALLTRTLELARLCRSEVNKIKGLFCFGHETVGSPGIFDLDETKLAITVADSGLTGYEVSNYLNREFKIQVEYADLFSVLVLISIGNSEKEIRRLVAGLQEIVQKHASHQPLASRRKLRLPSFIPESVMTPRQAMFAPVTKIPFKEAVGKISAEICSPYPPGIPIIVPGEKVTQEMVDYLREMHAVGARINGQDDPTLRTIKVIDESQLDHVPRNVDLEKLVTFVKGGGVDTPVLIG
jgi:arginine/lysine/ornithine decarboxylase